MAMINKKKKLMTTAIAGSMAAAVVVGGGTFAFLQSQTDDVVNNFKTEQVTVEISETPTDYDIIPGTEQDKDPKVTVKNTLDSFLYVKVTDNTYGLVTYEVDDTVWTKLDGYDDVYYRKVAPCEVDDEGNIVPQSFNVLKDDKVSYDKELVNEDMLDENGNLRTDVALTFSSFAIQARPFVDAADPDDPTTAPTEQEAAKNAFFAKNNPVTNQEELEEALSKASSGDTIYVSEGTYKLPATMPDIITIIGNNSENTLVDASEYNMYSSKKTINAENVTFTLNANQTLQFNGNGTFKNCTFDGTGGSGIYYLIQNGDLVFENCNIIGAVYGINIGEGTGNLLLKNCDISGWNSFGNNGTVTVEDCNFHFSNYEVVRFYQNATIKNCTFDENLQFIDANKSDTTVIIENCAGVTADKIYNNDDTVATWILDGVELTDVASH